MEKKNGRKKLLNVLKASIRKILVIWKRSYKYTHTHTHTYIYIYIGMVLKLEEALNTHWIGYMNMHAPDLMDLVK